MTETFDVGGRKNNKMPIVAGWDFPACFIQPSPSGLRSGGRFSNDVIVVLFIAAASNAQLLRATLSRPVDASLSRRVLSSSFDGDDTYRRVADERSLLRMKTEKFHHLRIEQAAANDAVACRASWYILFTTKGQNRPLTCQWQ